MSSLSEAVGEIFAARPSMVNLNSQEMFFELEQNGWALAEIRESLVLRPEGRQLGGQCSLRDLNEEAARRAPHAVPHLPLPPGGRCTERRRGAALPPSRRRSRSVGGAQGGAPTGRGGGPRSIDREHVVLGGSRAGGVAAGTPESSRARRMEVGRPGASGAGSRAAGAPGTRRRPGTGRGPLIQRSPPRGARLSPPPERVRLRHSLDRAGQLRHRPRRAATISLQGAIGLKAGRLPRRP